jgi:uncharacterized Ntn-hydrolase superfamily protein/CHAD domain-containing protein
VWAQTFGAPLQPVARIMSERRLRRLTDATGQILAEVADDRVTGRRLLPLDGTGDAAGAAASWREIQVELADGAGTLSGVVDARLRDRGLREAAAASELAHVLGRDDTAVHVADAGPGLTVTSPSGAVLLAHIRQQVAQVQAQDLPVRLDAPDSVHKLRVATRRLRSSLTTFKRLFDPGVARPLRAELKWLAGELGAARDAEVMRDRVRTAVESQSQELGVPAGADSAPSELTDAYRTAHDRVLAELDSDRYHRILTMLQSLVEQPPFRKRAQAPAGKVLPRLVARSYDRVRGLVEEAQGRPAGAERDELLHDARKAAKQARYAGEAVAPVFGRNATAFAAAMENVQEALGEHQDSVLTRDRLHTLGVHASSTEVAFLYGRLHALEEERPRGASRSTAGCRSSRLRNRSGSSSRGGGPAAGRCRLNGTGPVTDARSPLSTSVPADGPPGAMGRTTMTYSILGWEEADGDLGVAVASKFPGVGSLVPYGEAEVGVVATQGFGNPRHGSAGLTLLGCGATPQQAIDILLHGDDQAHRRQFALVDRCGGVAAHTGADLHTWDGWAGSCAGRHCVALGNGLAGADVVAEMVRAFEGTHLCLAERLMAALESGQRAGGDIRGQQSAALLVVRRDGGYGALDDRHVVISVYDHDRPLDELRRCYALHRLSYFPSDPAELVPIGPELAAELKQLMAAQGFYTGNPDGSWDAAVRRRWELFLGSENYDNRINDGALLDLEVLADLRRRYGTSAL